MEKKTMLKKKKQQSQKSHASRPFSPPPFHLLAEGPPLLLSLLLIGADLPLKLSLERLQGDFKPQPRILRLRQLFLQLLRLNSQVLSFCF